MDEDKQREIARKAARACLEDKRSFSQDSRLAAEAGRKGGQKVPDDEAQLLAGPSRLRVGGGRKGGHESGGNFANDRERAAEAGRKGGESRSNR